LTARRSAIGPVPRSRAARPTDRRARRSARRGGIAATFASPQLETGSPRRRFRMLRGVAGCVPHIERTALRSLAMEFTAIIVFTAIALWFVTEVGGENL
jgi:hypothetical protein